MLQLIVPEKVNIISNNVPAEYPEWNSIDTYSVGDVVSWNGITYSANRDSTNLDPYSNSGSISLLALSRSGVYSSWSGSKTYSNGNIVIYITYAKSSYYDYQYTDKHWKNGVKKRRYWYLIESINDANVENPYELLIKGNNSNYWSFLGWAWRILGSSNESAALYDPSIPESILNSLSTELTSNSTINLVTDVSKMNSMALLNVTCSSITVSFYNSVTEEVYSTSTTSGINTSDIVDWLSYFTYEPIYYPGNHYYTFPQIANIYCSISIEPVLGSASIGLIMAGKKISYGDVLFSPNYQIEDYSEKSADELGNVILAEGKSRDIIDLEIIFPVGKTDYIINGLKKYRATPLVYIIDDNYSNGIIYGFYTDLSVDFITKNMAHATLTVESL